MKDNNADLVTALIKRAIDFLFISNPRGTALGVLLGTVLYSLTRIFSPVLKTIKQIDLSQVNVAFYIVFGVFVTNIHLLFKKVRFDESVEGAFKFIKQAKKDGVGPAQIKMMYSSLYKQILDNVRLRGELERGINSTSTADSSPDITPPTS